MVLRYREHISIKSMEAFVGSSVTRRPRRDQDAGIQEDLTSPSLPSFLLIKNVYLPIQVFPLNHHNHFQDIKEITIVSLVRCDYTVTGPVFICGLWK